MSKTTMNETVNTNNVDDAEIAKFNELASRWWDRDSEFKPLHDINPLRINYINEHSPVAGMKVADIGCGGGLVSEGLARLGAEVTGIDMGEAPINVAKLHLLESNLDVEYQQTTAEELAEQRPGEYDIVTCLEMLEHVPDPASVISACARLVKPGGHVYFSTINRNAKAWLFAIVGAEYVLNMLPKGTHEYQKLIKPAELDQWARNAGLDTKHMTGMHYNPLTKHYKLDKGVDVNYLMYTIKSD
ncbi:MAG: bifunctional 2-polyprenyl-6-hydroxyphenol methylase/3-demethylubiquinol 3-O-methyltransferase UbiG [Arenicella sp.]